MNWPACTTEVPKTELNRCVNLDTTQTHNGTELTAHGRTATAATATAHKQPSEIENSDC